MADLRLLHDIDTGEEFYPYVHESGVLDDNGEKVIGSLMSDANYLNNKLIDKSVDFFPHIATAWKQGAPTDSRSTRLSSKDFIDITDGERLYLEFEGTAKVLVFFDYYVKVDGEYVKKTEAGYYSSYYDVSSKAHGLEYVKITLKKPDESNITPSEVTALTDNIKLYLSYEKEQNYTENPIKLRVLQFNIGKFNYGNSGGLDKNVEEKILNYKRYFSDLQADICCFQEYPMSNFTGYIETIDASGNYKPDETIFNQLYEFGGAKHFGCTTKDRIGLVSSVGISIDEEDTTYRTKGVLNTYKIKGKEVGLISGFFNVSAPTESRYAQLEDCISRLSSYEYAIICVDTNALSEEELTQQIVTAKANGYTCVNGGYWGYFNTLRTTSMYKNIDNIFVKGFKVVNANSVDTYGNLSSDHMPIYCDLLID